MITIPAPKILNAIEGGDIESRCDDGVIVVLIDLKPALTIPEAPTPQVRKSVDNSVTVLSGDVAIARIEAESADDAEEIAATFAHLLSMA